MALRIIIDTMHLIGLLSDESYMPLADAIDDGKVEATISVVSLTELIKILGKRDENRVRAIVSGLKASKVQILPLDTAAAEKAGYLRLRYDIPTADSLIGSTGIVVGASHILTSDRHFASLRSMIKAIGRDKLLKMIKKL